MKRFFIITGILVAVVIGSGVFLMKGSVMADRLSPFVEIDEYYTTVDTDGKHLGKDAIREDEESYKYQFKGYNKDGKKQDITIKVTKNLKHNAYLKIVSKGKNGKSWEEVQLEEIPQAAIKEIK